MRSGHDEESRNGREVKIDILDEGIRTPEWFRNGSGIFSKYREVTGTPRGNIGPTWAIGERGGSPKGVAAPPPYRESELD